MFKHLDSGDGEGNTIVLATNLYELVSIRNHDLY